jgi:hypothetical protein
MQIIAIIIGVVFIVVIYKISFAITKGFIGMFKSKQSQSCQTQYDLDPMKGTFYWAEDDKVFTIEDACKEMRAFIGFSVMDSVNEYDKHVTEQGKDKMILFRPVLLTFVSFHLAWFLAYINSRTAFPQGLVNDLIDGLIIEIISNDLVTGQTKEVCWKDTDLETIKELTIGYMIPFVEEYEKTTIPKDPRVAEQSIRDLIHYFDFNSDDFPIAGRNRFAEALTAQAYNLMYSIENRVRVRWVSNTIK